MNKSQMRHYLDDIGGLGHAKWLNDRNKKQRDKILNKHVANINELEEIEKKRLKRLKRS